jgi:serine/threonine protein kinase
MAIKIPILRTGSGTTALDETMSEASKLLDLSGRSKYIVQLRGILVDRLNVQATIKGDTMLYLKNPPAIIMEFMKGGNAKRLVEDPSYDSLYYSEKWGSIVMLLGQMIATALETVHTEDFVHLDVKPQNILFNVNPPVTGQETLDQMLSGTLVPKLADLGSAVRTGGKAAQFTSEYTSGEQVLGAGAATSMDIYALGATIYSMLTKTPVNSTKLISAMNNMIRDPGSGKAANDLKSAWNSFTLDLARIDPKFSPAIPLLKEMLSRDPNHRPPAGKVASSLRNLADKLSNQKK